MLDLNFVRENFDLVKRRLATRGPNAAVALEGFRELDAGRRRSLTEVETLRSRRNAASDEIARLKKSKQDASALIAEMKQVSDRIKELDEGAKKYGADLRELLAAVPNIPHESAPVGAGEADNVEVRRWGAKPEFSFTPKPHWELGEQLGILDFERAAKIAGARFAVYWGLGARLERALQNFMLDVHTRENGYTEVLPPFLVNSATLFGTGQLPKFAEDLFKLEGCDFWLLPTAEVPLTNLYRDETVEAERLPIKVTAFTPCFRSEAGSYGKDVRGLIRQHQFQKVELVKIAHPERSYHELEAMTRDAEGILQKLNLHYRVVELCTADLGFASAKTYDLEVWLPAQNLFREISSCSNCEAFQARRANIRFRPQQRGKTELAHTLNGSGLAIGRTWLAILENYQQEDGSVVIPEALRPYLNGADRITARAEAVSGKQ
jgi:seryl-tRNA synthetase